MPLVNPMRATARAIALSALLATATAAGAAAQMPGGSPGGAGSFRRAYLSEAYRAIDVVVVQWESAWLSGDVKDLMDLYTDDAVYMPASAAKPSAGRRDVQATLQSLFAARKDLHTRMVDFTASGDMAYYAGKYVFQTDPAAGPVRSESGTFVFILEHSPRGWKIRSHVEKPDPDTPLPVPAQATAAANDSLPAATVASH
jgi:uncharacterized protein (TIGR02246 family)